MFGHDFALVTLPYYLDIFPGSLTVAGVGLAYENNRKKSTFINLAPSKRKPVNEFLK
jgi:hypothetical protein